MSDDDRHAGRAPTQQEAAARLTALEPDARELALAAAVIELYRNTTPGDTVEAKRGKRHADVDLRRSTDHMRV